MGSASNPFMLVVMQEGGPLDASHEGQPNDVDLGETTAQSPAEFRAMQPGGTFDEDVECATPPPSASALASASPAAASKGNLPNTGGHSASALLLSVGITLFAVAGTLIAVRKRLIG